MVNLRPDADHPDRCNIVVDLDRVRRVLLRIAADIDELARARTVEDLEQRPDRSRRARRTRRRLAESPLAFPAHGRRIRQYRQALYEFEKGAGLLEGLVGPASSYKQMTCKLGSFADAPSAKRSPACSPVCVA